MSDNEDIDVDSDADKRAHHNALERKRRDHIKDSFSSLRDSVPALQGEKQSVKQASRAQILDKATDYIQYMRRKNHTHQQDIDDLKKQNALLEQQGVDFKMKTLKIDGIKVRVQIWDTAGQERYQTITKQYYRRAQGFILVYDITSSRSFQHIVKWASDVDEFALDKVQRILVGNKADEEQKRKVPKEQGNKLAKTYGMEFFETSACTNCNINESFTRLTELVLHAHKKDMDAFQGSMNKYLDMTYLEGEQDKEDNSQKACAC